MEEAPFGFVIFSDDVRSEVGGTITIVGSNPRDEILFPRISADTHMIPIVGVYIKIYIPKNYKFEKFNIYIHLEEKNNKKLLFDNVHKIDDMPKFSSRENDDDNEQEPLFRKVTVATRFPGILCNPPGRIRVKVAFDDKTSISIGSLKYHYME